VRRLTTSGLPWGSQDGATYSKDAVDGIKLAVDEINAKGGLLGKNPIKLFVADTQTNPGVAFVETKKLIEQSKVKAVIGTYSSATALAIKLFVGEGILHIATISNSEDITKLDFSPYTYSVVPNTYMQAKAVALGVAKVAKEKSWATYCTIASDYTWGRSTQELTVQFLRELVPNFKLARAFWPPLGEKNFVDTLHPCTLTSRIASLDPSPGKTTRIHEAGKDAG